MKYPLWRKFLSFLPFFGKQKRQFVYVAIGDSSVEGIGASHPSYSYPAQVFENIKKTYPSATFYNLGQNGARCQNVIDNQLPQLLKLKPNLVTISIGINDMRGKVYVAKFAKDLCALVETIQSETDAKIIINNIPDFSLLPTIPIYLRILAKIFIRRFNKAIETTARDFELVLVDIFKVSKRFHKRWHEFISEDGFHPSDSGYTLWADEIISNLKFI